MCKFHSQWPALWFAMVGAIAVSAHAAHRYDANWDSLDSRPAPQWFKDAKFGIFIHWGVYSVPAWGPKDKYAEWYWHDMQDRNGPTWQFHQRVYGDGFPYQDFAPRFKAEMWDPDQWADIFLRSGAKYVVLTSKHHEGFCLWQSREANRDWGTLWNSVDVGPKRDLLGDLTRSVRAKGLKMGFYYSLYEWFNPLYMHDFPRFRDEHFFPQFKDAVSKYKPSIIFADGEWEHTAAEWKTPELLAWLYNDGGCGVDLIINDRWGKDTRGKRGGYYTTEYGGYTGFKPGPSHAWEENRGMGSSYGYNRNEQYDDYRSTRELIHLLVKMASQGGNLLLDIGPTADGRIPVIMQDRLINIGQWLKSNGQAIYGTTAGPFPQESRAKAPIESWLSTAKPGKLFIHIFNWPRERSLLLPGLKNKVTSAYMLTDHAQAVQADPVVNGVTLKLPAVAPDPLATVVVIEIDGEPKVQ